MRRITALILVFVFVFSLCGCEEASGSGKKVEEHIEFEALDGSQSSLLNYNPDRGWRLEAYVNVGNSAEDRHTPQEDPAINVKRSVEKYAAYSPQLVQTYFYLTAYKEKPEIDEYGLDRIQQVFDCARELGVKLVVRFTYQYGMDGVGEADDDIMLGHMEQLAPLLQENIDVINVVEAGFLGSWGEWHSYPGHTWDDPGQISNEYFDGAVILRGILDMVPDDIYVQVRYPGIGELIDKEDPDHMRLGLNNDAFFGFRNQSGAWPYEEMGNSHCHKAQENSLTAPMGGEFFWGCQWNYADVTAEEAIKMFVRFHQNSFSVYHNSFEGTPEVAGRGDGAMWFATDREGDMSKWIHVPVTAAELESWGAYVSPSYFVNSRGEAVERSAFEYVRDHLGYRIEAKELTIDGRISRGETVALSMDLVNYGFSAAFNMTGEFVVLDEDYNIVSRVTAGDPAAWNNREGFTTHTVSAEFALPKEGGSYKIAYYLHNSKDEGAYFANDFDRFNGFNILYAFEL